MGEQRIQEVNMVALIFLLLGIVFLLAAAGRIWIDATPLDSQSIDSAVTNNPGEPATLNHMSEGKDSVV
jgi:hypothetical protein